MSVNYVNKLTGDLIRVAGQGKAEYGASTERKGDITIPATTAGNFQTVNIVFAQAMPDNDYVVVIDEGGETWAHGTTNVTNKTATGFTLFFLNVAGSDAPQMTFKYRAFKLYTDTEYNNLLNNAVLTSDVTDAVENGNMNPVTSNAVAEAIPKLRKYDNFTNFGTYEGSSLTIQPGEEQWVRLTGVVADLTKEVFVPRYFGGEGSLIVVNWSVVPTGVFDVGDVIALCYNKSSAPITISGAWFDIISIIN